METKRVKRFVYEGLGFPIALTDVTMGKIRGAWTPLIDYNKLQKEVLLVLSHRPLPLTGNEVHFIRTYFEWSLENFGKQFGISDAMILSWEKTKNRPAKISPTTELYIRLFILEKLGINNQVFRDTFREFNAQRIAKEQKAPVKARRPLPLSSHFPRRARMART